MATINWLGRLDGGKPDSKLWRGKISASASTIASRFNLKDERETAVLLDKLKSQMNDYFSGTSPGASERCIDGRVAAYQPEQKPKLGPQAPGGTPAAVLSYRVAKFSQMPKGITIVNDFEGLSATLHNLGIHFSPGAHEDEHCDDPKNPNTGCGAIDKMLEILELMSSDETKELMHAYTGAIAAAYFDDEVFGEVRRRLKAINAPYVRSHYFMRDEKTGHYDYANKLIRTPKQKVEKLLGSHNELLLSVNKRENETFDRDRFSYDNGHLAQAFNYDFWYTVKRVGMLFSKEADGRIIKAAIITNVMYAVGTAMALTDGSLAVGLRE